MNKVKLLEDYINYLSSKKLTRKFITTILGYKLQYGDKTIIHVRGNDNQISLYFYLRRKQQNKLIIYHFINLYNQQYIHHTVDSDIEIYQIYLKKCNYIRTRDRNYNNLIKLSQIINNNPQELKDLLSTK